MIIQLNIYSLTCFLTKEPNRRRGQNSNRKVKKWHGMGLYCVPKMADYLLIIFSLAYTIYAYKNRKKKHTTPLIANRKGGFRSTAQQHGGEGTFL